MKSSIHRIIEDCPVIAAVKNYEELDKSLTSDIQIIFILFGDIMTIQDIVRKIKDAGRIAFVHMDLIQGLSSKDIALDFIRNTANADGIITTKHALIKHAKEIGLHTVLRYFVIDSMALLNIEKANDLNQPDFIEILPGVMPKIIRKVNKLSRVPVIAGGLIADKEDVMAALASGAVSISTTKQDIWFM